MSIAEFSATMKANAVKGVASAEVKNLLDRLAKSASSTYKTKIGLNREASILNEDSLAFRKAGGKQGRTRLVITEDFIQELFTTFSIVGKTSSPIDYYIDFLVKGPSSKYKIKHFEFYNQKQETVSFNTKNTKLQDIDTSKYTNLLAVRGLNFSHVHTLEHIADFLVYLGVPGNRASISTTLSGMYERGHIYAQTTGRQLASLKDLDIEDNILTKILDLSIQLDEATTGLNKPKYTKILANIKKDFTQGKQLYMNIELQAIRNDLGTGNQDANEVTKGLRIISTLRNLIDNVTFSRSGSLLSKPDGISSVKEIEKQLNNLISKIQKYEQQIINMLAYTMSNPESYILTLKSSDSLKEYLTDSMIEILKTGKSVKSIKVDRKNILLHTIESKKQSIGSTKKLQQLVKVQKKEVDNLQKTISKGTKLRNLSGQFTSLTSLQILLNQRLHDQIKSNMGSPRLNYKTGRFAKSAEVTSLSVSRQGMITAFYTYMKYPYQTFEPGYEQGSIQRNPKELISRSIREIATGIVGNRMRAVSV